MRTRNSQGKQQMKMRTRAILIALVILSCTRAYSQALLPPPSDIAGASLTLLPDGRWLRVGGVRQGSPAGDAAIVDAAGIEHPLAWHLVYPRAEHTTTVLTDGHLLVVGGIGSDGLPVSVIETIDPAIGVIDTLSAPMELRRSHHTATLTPSGTLLIIGGVDQDTALADSGTWNRATQTYAALKVNLSIRRTGHSSSLDTSG